ncbi:MAG TPA: hypothetical protein VKS43_00050 [Burkholderiales bacterium]|nr:hypothetical protein [Burkholderiales bacterium]
MRRDLIYICALQRAGDLAGGENALANRLGVQVELLRQWQSGDTPIPGGVFLKVATILADDSVARIARDRPGE